MHILWKVSHCMSGTRAHSEVMNPIHFEVGETAVTILSDDRFHGVAKDAIFEAREIIKRKISNDEFFLTTYEPYPIKQEDDYLIKRMCQASEIAGVGPMGLACINYVLHREDRHPSLFVVTDIDQARLDRAASLYTVEFAKSRGIELHYVNTGSGDPVEALRALTGGTGYDEVVVMAPVPAVVEQADAILGFDGCLNFFSGPGRSDFKAPFNFYNVHYASTHVVGTSGGNTDDMKEALDLMGKGMDPAGLVTHIGGLNAVIDTTLNLPDIKGGKKLIYTHIEMPLTAIADFEEKGRTNPVYAELDRICKAHQGLWSVEAENYLLSHPENL